MRRTTRAQDIRLVCAFPPGSGADVLVRYFAEKLRPIANRTVIVENKAGAGGNIATEYVAQSKPDGYTIYVHAGTAVAANQSLFKNPPVDVARDIRVAATINRQPFMLVVDAKSPYKTVAELTEAMKQKGDKASYATAAPTGRIMGEIYKKATGIKAVEVNYRTAPDSLNEMPSGKLDFGMHDPVFSLAQQREGRLRILAVSTGAAARMRSPGTADHGGTRHPDGPDRLVGRDAAGRHAQAGDRQDPSMVRPDGLVGRDQEVPQQLRRRPLHQFAGAGAGDARTRRQGVGRVRQDGQDRADVRRMRRDGTVVRRAHVRSAGATS